MNGGRNFDAILAGRLHRVSQKLNCLQDSCLVLFWVAICLTIRSWAVREVDLVALETLSTLSFLLLATRKMHLVALETLLVLKRIAPGRVTVVCITTALLAILILLLISSFFLSCFCSFVFFLPFLCVLTVFMAALARLAITIPVALPAGRIFGLFLLVVHHVWVHKWRFCVCPDITRVECSRQHTSLVHNCGFKRIEIKLSLLYLCVRRLEYCCSHFLMCHLTNQKFIVHCIREDCARFL